MGRAGWPGAWRGDLPAHRTALPAPANLVGVLPRVVQQVLALHPAGQVVTQAGRHDLPQVGHLALRRRLHLGVHEEPGLRAHGIDCKESQV